MSSPPPDPLIDGQRGLLFSNTHHRHNQMSNKSSPHLDTLDCGNGARWTLQLLSRGHFEDSWVTRECPVDGLASITRGEAMHQDLHASILADLLHTEHLRILLPSNQTCDQSKVIPPIKTCLSTVSCFGQKCPLND